jgi:hypothetical protein
MSTLTRYRIDREEHFAANPDELFRAMWQGGFDPDRWATLKEYTTAYRDRVYQVHGKWIDDSTPTGLLQGMVQHGLAEVVID